MGIFSSFTFWMWFDIAMAIVGLVQENFMWTMVFALVALFNWWHIDTPRENKDA